MDDRRKKLEELRNKRIKPTTVAETAPAVITSGVLGVPSEPTTNSKKIDEIIKGLEKNRSSLRYKSDSLFIVQNINEYIFGIDPLRKMNDKVGGQAKEVYDVYVQCKLDEENQNQSDEEDVKVNINKEKGHRKSIIGMKSKNIFALSQKKGNEDEKGKVDKFDEILSTIGSNFNTQTTRNDKSNKIVFNDDLKKQILQSHELNEFLVRNSKYIERTLGEKEIYDAFKTYYNENDDEDLEGSKRSLITHSLDFFDMELCQKRTVNSLEWSVKHQELLLASYTKSTEFSLDQSDGLILLWSLAMRKAPEFTFTCQTEITAATFHKFNPKLVIGATYTGQIMIWDTRGKSLPVQKTPPGGKYHSHPIYCLGVNGSTNSNNIISVSNNGLLYTWAGNLYTSAGNALHKPAKKIELKTKKRRNDKGPDNIPTIQTNNNDDLGAICMATSELDNNSVLIGTDDSDIYQVSLNATNNDTTDNIIEVFRKHNGPITSIDMHPGDFHKNSNFSNLFLSTSADWTINLWSKSSSEAPLFTFDVNDDYVYDTKWHPTNPSLFASCGASGRLDLWDLNKDTEMPSTYFEVGKNILNKLSWSSDGKRICIGDNIGKVTVLNIEKEIYNSKLEDSLKFEKAINYVKNSKKVY